MLISVQRKKKKNKKPKKGRKSENRFETSVSPLITRRIHENEVSAKGKTGNDQAKKRPKRCIKTQIKQKRPNAKHGQK